MSVSNLYAQEHVLMGLKFAIVDTTPIGDAVLSPSDNLSWEISADTWVLLNQRSLKFRF